MMLLLGDTTNLHTKRLNVPRSNLTGSYYLATPTMEVKSQWSSSHG